MTSRTRGAKNCMYAVGAEKEHSIICVKSEPINGVENESRWIPHGPPKPVSARLRRLGHAGTRCSSISAR